MKKTLVFKYLKELPAFSIATEGAFANTISGSQAPTLQVDADSVGIWFSARDTQSRSRPVQYLLDNNLELQAISFFGPRTSKGPDEDGVMPSHVYNDSLLYAGWNKGNDQIRYRTCSMAWDSKKDEKAVLIDRPPQALYGTSMPFQASEVALYFMGYTNWTGLTSEGLREPIYDIFVQNLLTGECTHAGDYWNLPKTAFVRARPIVLKATPDGIPDTLWYSERAMFGYRSKKTNSYKLKATMIDAPEQPKGECFQVKILGAEFDLMQAYGYPVVINGQTYLFYNNDFRSPIQVAVFKGIE